MCDLLGLSYSTPVKASISLDLFQLQGTINPDGWGIAYYSGSNAQLVKEASPASGSKLYDFVERYPESRVFLSHVRRSTMGNRSYMNTHPFYRVYSQAKERYELCFAHNGTITDLQRYALGRFRPIGETDSEYIFCYLLGQLAEQGISAWSPDGYKFIEEILGDINSIASTMNCIFTDGQRMFCYSDEASHNGGLRYQFHGYPFGQVDLIEEQVHLGAIDVKDGSIPSTEDIHGSGYIISTRLLTSSSWTSIRPGSLMVFRDGNVEYGH